MICENESGKASVGYSGVLGRISKKGDYLPKNAEPRHSEKLTRETNIICQEQRFHELSV